VTAVVGPNGSGKSTLVRALLGRVPLARGRVRVDGIDARAIDARERARRVAVVPQREESAFPLAVREYVGLGRLPHGGRWGGPSRLDREASPTPSRIPTASPLAIA
jgi:iron complex transport system ATP-binding protein